MLTQSRPVQVCCNSEITELQKLATTDYLTGAGAGAGGAKGAGAGLP